MVREAPDEPVDQPANRRLVLKSLTAVAGTGVLGSLAGCSDRGGGDGGSKPAETDGGDGDGGGGKTTTDDKGSSDPITVGGLFPLSGPYSPLGKGLKHGTEAVATRINDQGGLNGRDVTTAFEDTEGKPNSGKQAVRRLVESEGVDVLVGPVSSAVAPLIVDYAYENDVVHFSMNAINETTMNGCKATTFRWPIRNRQHANAAGSWTLNNLGRNVWIHYADYNWGQVMAEDFKAKLNEAGDVNIVGETKSKLGAKDYSTYLSQMSSSEADWVLQAMVGGDAIHFVKQAAGYGLKDEMDIFAPANSLQIVRGATKDASIGTYSNAEYYENLDSNANKQFKKTYKNEFDSVPGRFACDSWSSLTAWAKAANEAGSVATDDIISTLPGMNFQSPVGEAYFRKCDHQASRPIMISEITKPGEYKWPDLKIHKRIGGDDGLDPCSKVGCSL